MSDTVPTTATEQVGTPRRVATTTTTATATATVVLPDQIYVSPDKGQALLRELTPLLESGHTVALDLEKVEVIGTPFITTGLKPLLVQHAGRLKVTNTRPLVRDVIRQVVTRERPSSDRSSWALLENSEV